MNSAYINQGRTSFAKLLTGLLLAATLSGCQTARQGVANHPFARMFEGYDYSANRSSSNEPGATAAAARNTYAGLTNSDLIQMTQTGSLPQEIVAEIQLQGGRFQITDQAVQELDAAGVSPEVIASVKRIAAYTANVELEQADDGTIHTVTIPGHSTGSEADRAPVKAASLFTDKPSIRRGNAPRWR